MKICPGGVGKAQFEEAYLRGDRFEGLMGFWDGRSIEQPVLAVVMQICRSHMKRQRDMANKQKKPS